MDAFQAERAFTRKINENNSTEAHGVSPPDDLDCGAEIFPSSAPVQDVYAATGVGDLEQDASRV